MPVLKPYHFGLTTWRCWREPLLGSFAVAAVSMLGLLFGNTNSEVPLWETVALTYIISVFIWVSNQEASSYFDAKYAWDAAPKKRLLNMLAFNLVAGALILGFALMAFSAITPNAALTKGQWVSALAFGLLITLFINVFYVIRYFLETWKQTFLEQEKFKVVALSAELEALRKQMDPHFLFNSLTTLDELIYQNPQIASDYLAQLAACYRYILDHQNQTEVDVQEELGFSENFLALLRLKLGNNFQVHAQIAEGVSGKVPFLTLQRLLENVVKHNAITTAQPMEIYVTLTHHFLEVRNKWQPKTPAASTSGLGLANLQKHYHLLGLTPPHVQQHNGWFAVQVPLITP